jgi:sensor histidine kinase YesM
MPYFAVDNTMQEKRTTYHNSVTDFLIEPPFRIYRHALLFLFLAVIVLYDSALTYRDSAGRQEHIITVRTLILFLSYSGAIYLNMYVLVPRFLLPKRYGLYMLSFSCIILFLLFTGFTPEIFAGKSSSVRLTSIQFFALTFTYAICIAGSSVTVLFRRWTISGKRVNELEKSTVQSELEYLKTQVNPDFLFNMLDKSVQLTRVAPERASNVLMKLSKLLRYQLYDSAREKVLLNAEITFLKNFLELEKDRRNGNNFSFSIHTEGNINPILIPPLLLAPFVEYAVNRMDTEEKTLSVNLLFQVEDNRLRFTCVAAKPEPSHDDNGLSNVKRRLALLFPASHSLELTENSIKLELNV